jgi:putative nucleotidyltransferase with HDIG domain
LQVKKAIAHPIFETIAQTARLNQTDAYVIGGYVRDFLLKRNSKDIDIVTTGNGIDLATAVAKALPGQPHVSVFKRFGTAMIKYQDMEVEFVGARKESYRSDSRKPFCESGTLEDDQNRRDFTINALAISLNEEDYGSLHDPFDGLADMKAKLLRTPLQAEKTYSDDPLRMMRAIRFANQLDFKIEEQSFQAIIKSKERIGIVSQERITDELNKIILTKTPSIGFKLLFDSKLLGHIFPEMVALHGVQFIGGKGHKDNFYHTLQVLDNLSKKSDHLWLRWAAILHDIGKPDTKRFEKGNGWTFHGHDDLGAKMVPQIFRRLKLPMDHKMKYVQKLVRLHLRPIALVKDIVSDSAIRRLLMDASDDIDDLMLLCEADVTTKNQDKQQKFKANFKKVRKKLKEVEEKDHLRNWQPPVSGEEIMRVFNIKPSKEVGDIKKAIREAILEGHIQNNHDEAFAYMLKAAEEMGLRPANEKA